MMTKTYMSVSFVLVSLCEGIFVCMASFLLGSFVRMLDIILFMINASTIQIVVCSNKKVYCVTLWGYKNMQLGC